MHPELPTLVDGVILIKILRRKAAEIGHWLDAAQGLSTRRCGLWGS